LTSSRYCRPDGEPPGDGRAALRFDINFPATDSPAATACRLARSTVLPASATTPGYGEFLIDERSSRC
jgi:hypothetical protein